MSMPYDPMAFTVILTTPADTVNASAIRPNVDNRVDNPRDWE